jgi:hypothetical protein
MTGYKTDFQLFFSQFSEPMIDPNSVQCSELRHESGKPQGCHQQPPPTSYLPVRSHPKYQIVFLFCLKYQRHKHSMEPRILTLERRVSYLEDIIASLNKDLDDSSEVEEDSNSDTDEEPCKEDSPQWKVVSTRDTSISQLTAVVVGLYHGRNVEGFTSFVSSTLSCSTSAHLLLPNKTCQPDRVLAAILVKRMPTGQRIVLELHSSLQYLPLVADRYMELFENGDNVFAEIGSGPLEDELRESGEQCVTDSRIICYISHVPPKMVMINPSDPRRLAYATHNGSPAPLGSYITNAGKRMCLYGNPRVSTRK